jgi:hypothetical protein
VAQWHIRRLDANNKVSWRAARVRQLKSQLKKAKKE